MTTAVVPNDLDYAFDPYGNAPANRITDEYHIITADNSRRYNVLIPLKAPFFANSFQATATVPNVGTIPLVLGVHYAFAFEHQAATRKCGRPVYGGIVFVDEAFSGTVRINHYQTLGGDWVLDEASLSELLANTIYNPRVTTWEKILGLPYEFPTIDHEHNVEDLGMSSVVQALDRIEQTLGGTGGADFPTLEELGLDQIPNLPLATDPIAAAAQSRNHLMSPMGVRLAIQALVLNDFLTFIQRTDNPNGVTAAQTGAYTQSQVDALLQNYLTTSGTAANSQLLDGRTRAQIIAEALQGTAANSLLFNGYTVEEVQALILQGTAANAQRFDNKTYADLLASLQQDSDASQYFLNQVITTKSENTAGSLEYLYIADARSVADGDFQDGYLLVVGGNQAQVQKTPMWLVRFTNNLTAGEGTYGLEVVELTNTGLAVSFGLVVDTSTNPLDPAIRIWMRGTSPMDQITVSELTKEVFTLLTGEAHTLVAPAGVTWNTPARGIWNAQRLGGVLPADYMLEADFVGAVSDVLADLQA